MALLARQVILEERLLWYGAISVRPSGTMSSTLHFIRKVFVLCVLNKNRTMDNVQKHNNCISLSQTFKILLIKLILHSLFRELHLGYDILPHTAITLVFYCYAKHRGMFHTQSYGSTRPLGLSVSTQVNRRLCLRNSETTDSKCHAHCKTRHYQ
jgi:hypothetical protein